MKVRLTRDVRPSECSWLERAYKRGEEFYMYDGHTYECISDGGSALSEDGDTPFFEIPNNAFERIPTLTLEK